MKPYSHMFYYSVMAFIFICCFVLAMLYGVTKPAKMLLVVTGACLYVAFGIAHHVRDHDVSIKIVFEYLCFASLGIGIMFFALGN